MSDSNWKDVAYKWIKGEGTGKMIKRVIINSIPLPNIFLPAHLELSTQPFLGFLLQ